MPVPPPPGHPRLLIIGAYGMTNLADDAILAAMLAELRAALPGAGFSVVAQDPIALPRAADLTPIPFTDRAIREANLGLNPIVEGTLLRIPIPELNAERRQELVKVAHRYAEQARVAVRHVRRDGLDLAKKEEKDGVLSQDDQHALGEQIQKLTDATISEIDQMLAHKEAEITQI